MNDLNMYEPKLVPKNHYNHRRKPKLRRVLKPSTTTTKTKSKSENAAVPQTSQMVITKPDGDQISTHINDLARSSVSLRCQLLYKYVIVINIFTHRVSFKVHRISLWIWLRHQPNRAWIPRNYLHLIRHSLRHYKLWLRSKCVKYCNPLCKRSARWSRRRWVHKHYLSLIYFGLLFLPPLCGCKVLQSTYNFNPLAVLYIYTRILEYKTRILNAKVNANVDNRQILISVVWIRCRNRTISKIHTNELQRPQKNIRNS